MNRHLRRLGILVFVMLSLLLWREVADWFTHSVLTPGKGFWIMMLGSSLACLTVLIASEISTRGRGMLDSTRNVTLLAERFPSDPENDNDPRENLYLAGMIAPDGASPYGAASSKREWIDAYQSVELEGSGG